MISSPCSTTRSCSPESGSKDGPNQDRCKVILGKGGLRKRTTCFFTVNTCDWFVFLVGADNGEIKRVNVGGKDKCLDGVWQEDPVEPRS